MTISTTTNSVQYNGNGVTTVFPVPFIFYDDTDLIATTTIVATGVSTVLTASDYSISGGEGATGSLTVNTPVAVGTRITIERDLPYTQGDDFLEGNTVQAETVEEAFDRNVIFAQQNAADIALALKFPNTDPAGLTTAIPSSVDRASKLLGFDASGNVTTFDDSVSSAAAAAASAAAAAASAASIALPLPIASGGSGQTSKTNAFDALSPATTKGDIIAYNGSDNVRLAVGTDGLALVADSSQATGLKYAAVASFPTVAFTDRVLTGLTMSNGTDAVNDINIAAGSCVSDDGTTVMTLTAITKQLDAAWAVGTNLGGRDAGAISDNTWHVWVINRTDTNVTDVLFSLSASAPTMPTSYTKKKCIGSIIRLSASLLGFVQLRNQFWLKTSALYTSSANPGTAAFTVTLAQIPTGANFLADLNAQVYDPNLISIASLVSDLSLTDEGPINYSGAVNSDGPTSASSGSVLGAQGGNKFVRTNTAAQVRARISASNAGTILYIRSRGWIDQRI